MPGLQGVGRPRGLGARTPGVRAAVSRDHQFVAAMRLRLEQPRMSDIQHDKLDRLSLQKLIRLLANVDRRVTMHVDNVGSPTNA